MPKDATHWSVRSMAEKTGVSHTTVLGSGRRSEAAPERDVQAVDGPAVRPGYRGALHGAGPRGSCASTRSRRSRRWTGRSRSCRWRRGRPSGEPTTTPVTAPTLFAALDVATGAVIGKCYRRHRAKEFLAFLKEVEAAVPEGLDVMANVLRGYFMLLFASRKTCIARWPNSTPTSCPPWKRATGSASPTSGSGRLTRSLHPSGGSASRRTNSAWAKRFDTNLRFGRLACLRDKGGSGDHENGLPGARDHRRERPGSGGIRPQVGAYLHGHRRPSEGDVRGRPVLRHGERAKPWMRGRPETRNARSRSGTRS